MRSGRRRTWDQYVIAIPSPRNSYCGYAWIDARAPSILARLRSRSCPCQNEWSQQKQTVKEVAPEQPALRFHFCLITLGLRPAHRYLAGTTQAVAITKTAPYSRFSEGKARSLLDQCALLRPQARRAPREGHQIYSQHPCDHIPAASAQSVSESNR